MFMFTNLSKHACITYIHTTKSRQDGLKSTQAEEAQITRCRNRFKNYHTTCKRNAQSAFMVGTRVPTSYNKRCIQLWIQFWITNSLRRFLWTYGMQLGDHKRFHAWARTHKHISIHLWAAGKTVALSTIYWIPSRRLVKILTASLRLLCPAREGRCRLQMIMSTPHQDAPSSTVVMQTQHGGIHSVITYGQNWKWTRSFEVG